MALCSDHTLVTWGGNSDGQLGNNSTTNSLVPLVVSSAGILSGKTVVNITSGMNSKLCTSAPMGHLPRGVTTSIGATGQQQYHQQPRACGGQRTAAFRQRARFSRWLSAVHSATNQQIPASIAEPPSAQIVVQQPAGTNLSPGGIVNFASSPVGTGTTLTFTLLNNVRPLIDHLGD